MSDDNRLNRPNLKYENYFKEPLQTAIEPAAKSPIEKATIILLGLCCIPFLGGIFALATVILGVILITKDRLLFGLTAIIVAPLASTLISMFVFVNFIVAAGSAATKQLETEFKKLPPPQPVAFSIPTPRPVTKTIPTPTPRIKAAEASVDGHPIK